MNLQSVRVILHKAAKNRLYVGFSGGADSTALLLLAKQFQKELDYSLCAVHFEHGLRGQESLADAEYCESFAQKFDIEFIRINLVIPASSDGFESEARKLRQKAFEQLVHASSGVVALGHHADDKVENLFLRACRGSNASGMTGLKDFRVIKGVTYLRPLLNTTRQEIENFLRQSGIDNWRTDCTNSDNEIARNAIRNQVIPALKQVMPFAGCGLYRSLDALSQDADCLEALADTQLSSGNPSSRQWWLFLHPAIRVRVLRNFLSRSIGVDIIPNGALLERFSKLIESAPRQTKSLEISDKWNLSCRNDEIILSPSATFVQPIEWNWQVTPRQSGFAAELIKTLPDRKSITLNEAFFDADALPPTLYLTTRQDGDCIKLFGGNSSKVKKILIDAKLSLETLRSLMILRDSSDQILWIPSLRHSATYPVSDKTRKIVRFIVEKPTK